MSDIHIGRLENKKMRLNFKKAKIQKKYYFFILESIIHYKDWMFLNNDLTHIEILPPKLETLTMMKQYNMCFVVKGFKTPFEHSIYERLRFKHGFYSMMYASRRAGINILMKALNSLANDEPMPSQEEINTAIENNNLTNISNEKEEKQVKERIKYKQLSEKYSIILHRKAFQLITQN